MDFRSARPTCRHVRALVLGLGVSLLSPAFAPVALAAGNAPVEAAAKPGGDEKDGKFGKGKFGKGERGGKGRKGMRGGWFRDLDLSAEQKAKMKEIRKQNRDKIKGLRTDMRAKHEALRAALVSDGAVDKARALHGEIQGLRRQLDDLHFESMLEIRGLLTPEQRQKFAESMDRGPGGPGGPMGPEGPMGDGPGGPDGDEED